MLPIIAFSALFFGVIGWAIGNEKGYPGEGVLAGVLLGPIGVVIMICIRPSADVDEELEVRACPWCAESIKARAQVCRHCGRDVDPVVS